MLNLPNPRINLFALTTAAVLATAGAASAQSDRDLRQENQALQTQVRELQRELDAARASITQLERILARRLGQSERPAADTATQPDAERVTIDESEPNASPRALFKAVTGSYVEATRDLDIGDFNSTAGTRARVAYLRAVEAWANRARREMKSPVQWHIRLLPLAEQSDGPDSVRARAVDPETGVALGEPFMVSLSKTVQRKLNQLDQRGPVEVLVLKGVLIPEATVNSLRKESGPFNNPRLIGPYAEFGFTVQASSLTPPPKSDASERGGRD